MKYTNIEFEIYNMENRNTCILKNDINQNVHRIYPKFVKWKYEGQLYNIEDEKTMTAIIIGKDFLILKYNDRSEKFEENENLVIYDFFGKLKHIVKSPILKTNELSKNKQYQGHYAGFERLERKNPNSPYEIFLKNEQHVLVSMYDKIHGAPLDDRAGKPHELQALNVETGKFHPTWCKYYGRM